MDIEHTGMSCSTLDSPMYVCLENPDGVPTVFTQPFNQRETRVHDDILPVSMRLILLRVLTVRIPEAAQGK